MFYSVKDDKLTEIKLEEHKEEEITVGYITLEELKECYTSFGFEERSVHSCEQAEAYFHTGLDIYDDYSFGNIKITDVMGANKQKDRIAMFLKKNLFIFVAVHDTDESTKEIFKKALSRYKQNITLEKLVYAVLDELTSNANSAIDMVQKELQKIEKGLTDNKLSSNTNKALMDIKNKMLMQKHYYSQLLEFGQALIIDSNNIFSQENLRYLTIFNREADRLCDSIQFLFDSAVHIREAYEDSINNSMNRTMQLFTVLSAVFLPLTLLVGWYGMNFKNMPELSWKYGYAGVGVLSGIILLICFIWFKKKKYLK